MSWWRIFLHKYTKIIVQLPLFLISDYLNYDSRLSLEQFVSEQRELNSLCTIAFWSIFRNECHLMTCTGLASLAKYLRESIFKPTANVNKMVDLPQLSIWKNWSSRKTLTAVNKRKIVCDERVRRLPIIDRMMVWHWVQETAINVRR